MINRVIKFLGLKPKRKRRSVRTRRNYKITHQGEHYNLKELYDRLNAQYFDNKLDLPIMWVGNRLLKPRTRVMFGSYDHYQKLIRIHRRLDQAHIPEYFIAYIVYHEMLHYVLPPIYERRRRKIHHPAFIEKEREFVDYDQAQSFSTQMKKTWFRDSSF